MCADLSKTVEIVFGGRDELSGVMGSVSRDFDALTGSIQNVTAPLANAADAILKFSAAVAAIAGGAMALAIKEAGEFGGKFGEITTLIKDTGAPIQQFHDNVLEYSTGSVKSIEDIQQALYFAISAGVDYNDSLKFINQSEMLAVAGRSNLADTTKSLISVLNAYGASTDQAAKYSDIMFQTVRIGQTTMTEMSESLAKVTPLAAAAGIPFETLSAALAALTVQGMPTNIAMTALRGVIQGMLDPSEQAAKLAKELGLELGASAIQSKGFEGVLRDVYDATGGNIEKLEILFGNIRGLTGVLALGTDSSGKFKEALAAMADAAGSTEVAYAKLVDGFTNTNTRLVNQIKVVAIKVGEELMPVYKDVVNSLGEAFAAFQINFEAGDFDPIMDFIRQAGEKLAALISDIAANLPAALEGLDFSKLITALKNLGGALGEAFKAVFGNIDLTTAEGLHTFIQKIIDGFTKLVEVTKGVIDGMAPLFKGIGLLIDQVTTADSSTMQFMGTLMGLGKSLNVLLENTGLISAALAIFSGKIIIDVLVGLNALGLSVVGLGAKITTMTSAWMLMNPMLSAAGLGIMAGALLNQTEFVKENAQAFLGLIDVNENFFGAQSRTKEEMAKVNAEFEAAVAKNKALKEGIAGTTGELDAAGQSTRSWIDSIKGMPADLKVEVKTAMASDALDETKFEIAEALAMGDYNRVRILTALAKAEAIDVQNEMTLMFPPVLRSSIQVNADGSTIQTAKGLILQTFPDDRPASITSVGMTVDEWNLAATKSKISAAFPEKLPVELQVQIDIANIKATSDIVQKAIEWKAKIDIAQIEASAKIIEAMFGSINTTIESTGDTMSSLFGTLAEMQGMGTGLIERQIEEEARRRDEALRLQTELTEAQIELLRQQVRSLRRSR